jgi:copper chaperone CopZ
MNHSTSTAINTSVALPALSMIRLSRSVTLALAVCGAALAPAFLGGCASSGSQAAKGSAATEPEYEEGAVLHQGTAADKAALASKTPLESSAATLYVNGLGCPLCATNVDMQLKRVPGVSNMQVDLSTGKVDIAMAGPVKPSPKRLADAIADAGFTLVKIETR